MTKSENTKLIPLTQGKFALVDTEDYEYLNQWKWQYSSCGYATRTERIYKIKESKTVSMHRLIMNTPFEKETDHINRNKLDNRKINLRVCSRSQNQANNKKYEKCTSKYKGVCWHKKAKKWTARIMFKRKHINIGCFTSEESAAIAYNKKAIELFGEFAYINIVT